ncbi:hypothetical protein BDY24DRAFT_397412 [Mrakia frigida]|uniref:uncharacterized protein n=1 Tax=Mrakia frigida TaxID=29902 RepID=UPI003FCC1FAB
MVVIKILKHALDFPTSDITGQLLGLDLNGTLEVSDSFPLPALPPSERGADEEKERAAHRAAHATYSAEMLRALKQISAVDSVVGAYFSSPSGAFFKPSLIDAVALYQSVGGRKGVVLVYDPTKSTQGTVSLRAFRFSSNFADAYAKGKFDTQSLIAHQLTPSTLLSELPVTLTSTSLLTAFLSSLPSAPSTTPNQPLSLNLPSSLLSSLQHTSQSLDDYRRESDSLSYNARDIARQKAKVEQLVHSGTSEEEARRIVRVPEEASRLNGLLMLGQADEFAKGMAGAAGGGVARMYASTQI